MSICIKRVELARNRRLRMPDQGRDGDLGESKPFAMLANLCRSAWSVISASGMSSKTLLPVIMRGALY